MLTTDQIDAIRDQFAPDDMPSRATVQRIAELLAASAPTPSAPTAPAQEARRGLNDFTFGWFLRQIPKRLSDDEDDKKALRKACEWLVSEAAAPAQEQCTHQWTWADGKCADCGAIANPSSPTADMTLKDRIEHVGGRTNAAGYIEFGSPMAVDALIRHALRDHNAAPAQGEPVAAWINYPCKIENGEFAGHGEPELSFSRAAYGYDYEKAEPLFRRAPAVAQPLTQQGVRLLAMRHANRYTEFDDGSLHTLDFGEYGFANFARALLANGE